MYSKEFYNRLTNILTSLTSIEKKEEAINSLYLEFTTDEQKHAEIIKLQDESQADIPQFDNDYHL